MSYCLNQQELEQLIDYMLYNRAGDDLAIEKIELSEAWVEELYGLTYFLARILETKAKQGINPNEIIEFFYGLPEKMWFTIQQADAEFVEYMMDRERTSGTIDEMLIDLQNRFSKYEY